MSPFTLSPPTVVRHRGFTLVELLVVIAIIGVLVSLLLPAVQAAREAARRAQCSSNLRQIALAVHHYESTLGAYPASFGRGAGTSVASGWSAQARILPFMEQNPLHNRVDFSRHYQLSTTADGRQVSTVRILIYGCPSEANNVPRTKGGAIVHHPLNYGFNAGVWFVFDPRTGAGGSGVIIPNGFITPGQITDGLSNTILAAEVKAFTPYFRNAGTAGSNPPTNSHSICSFGGEAKMGQDLMQNTGHTEWVDARVHQTGFTAAFPPNTKVLCSGFDVDFTNQQEGKSSTVVTYAAVTARSYHPTIVNVALMDGSVTQVREGISRAIWRAMATRNGGEQASLHD